MSAFKIETDDLSAAAALFTQQFKKACPSVGTYKVIAHCGSTLTIHVKHQKMKLSNLRRLITVAKANTASATEPRTAAIDFVLEKVAVSNPEVTRQMVETAYDIM